MMSENIYTERVKPSVRGRIKSFCQPIGRTDSGRISAADSGNTVISADNSLDGSTEHPKCLHNGSEGPCMPCIPCMLCAKPSAGCLPLRARNQGYCIVTPKP